jgi:spore coat polysaccharide biosynthesis protein SpsF
MRIVGVIQARVSSRRLPGKILLQLCGRPTLDYLVDALMRAQRLDGIVLATSTDPSDDQTALFARQRGIPCHRGSLENVALRMLGAGEEHQARAIVRINGDSPLMDPVIIDPAVPLFDEGPVDIVTNVHPRTFPKGQSVEVIALSALRAAVAAMGSSEEREHVTPYIYAHPELFSIVSFRADPPRPEIQLSIDDGEDFDRCAAILRALAGPPWQVGWRACVAAYDRHVVTRTLGTSS